MSRTVTSSRSRRALRTTLVCTLLAGLPALAVTTGGVPAAAASGGFVTFQATGHTQPFTVPAAVTQISVLAVGASGGAGSNGPGSSGSPGGAGGSVSATLPVTPGQVLTIDVGYFGGDAQGDVGGRGGGTPGFSQPFAGGGGSPSSSGGGGGGGGATAIQTRGLDSFPILVAGGGGGGGGGGAVAGENGGGGGSGSQPPGGSGGDGTGSGAGIGGSGGQSVYVQGDNGQISPPFSSSGGGGGGGFGANASLTTADGNTGGGGVGGTAGGAGGGGGGGGGAGSSYVESTAIGTPTYATATTRGAGQLSIFWSAPVPVTTLSASPDPARPGNVTVTATVAPPAAVTSPVPTGTVAFYLDGAATPTGSATLADGTAALNLSLISTGTYDVRAVYNGDDVYDTSEATVTATVVAPSVITGAPSTVGPKTATLTGTVNPNGVATTPVAFEYGTTTAYGTTTPTKYLPSGSVPMSVHAALTGLRPNTVYHYQLFVPPTLTTAPFYGPDRTFTTSASAMVAITTATLTPAIIGKPYTATLTGSGGTTPYHWSLASGALPAGLTLSPTTGTIKGTPTRLGTATFTIGIKDSATPTAAVATKALTLSVTPAPVTVTTALLPVATVGQAYTARLKASGGTSPYHWAVSTGSLPAGVALNPKTGAITGTPKAAGAFSITVRATDSSTPSPQSATAELGLSVQPGITPSVYVVNGGYSGVASFPLNAGGNLAPRTQITGSATGQLGTTGVTLDATGSLYVTNSANNSVTEYPNQATGNVMPTATIAGSNTGLSGPQADTVDGAGRLYVANQPANTITVYASGGSGNAAPVITLGGPDTQLAGPQSLAIDPTGHLFVGNSNNTITEYPPMASGDATPITAIGGPDTGLNGPQGLTIDAAGNLLVASTYGQRLTEYPTTARGDAPPVRVISGSATGLDFPDGLDIDTVGNIYVSNQFSDSITEYAANAIGNAAPIGVISGSNTGLSSPGHLAVAPPLSVLTTKLPTGVRGDAYHATLRAGLGTPPYRWQISPGPLPLGLHLDAVTGRITGTPRIGGTYRITVSVSDRSAPAMHDERRVTLLVRRNPAEGITSSTRTATGWWDGIVIGAVRIRRQ